MPVSKTRPRRPRARSRSTADRLAYDVEAEWSAADLALLAELQAAEELLPDDAPRGLLSVRLSVWTEDTTSPVRQELDLRVLAREMGVRVVGVASDLNVSATKVPPWKRKQLGDWLNNRAPEFDVLLFWKLDRFVRRLSDLGTMIRWCDKHHKNLVSKNDQIDLTTTAGQVMVTIIGGIAEIETANTSVRVTSLWDYTKTQSEWLIGKPVWGYYIDEDDAGNLILSIDPEIHRALHWCRNRALRGGSANRMRNTLVRAGLATESLKTSSLLRIFRNPALMGYRTEIDQATKKAVPVLDRNGNPIKVAEGIFTEDEFATFGVALDSRSRKKVAQPSGDTKFLGVMVCEDCTTNITVKTTRNKWGTYPYLRCQKCKGGGMGIPNPMEVYEEVVTNVLDAIGDFPVQTREYAQGGSARAEQKRLQDSVAYYMTGLEPGGKFTRTRFTKEQAEQTLDTLLEKLEAIDPASTQDRWVYVHNGRTFREQWETTGIQGMAADLVRVGIKCIVTRTKSPDDGAKAVKLKLQIPKDVRARLVIRTDEFAEEFEGK
ncbi:recombinase family protein [Kitasatospora sp. NPDC004723]|uniref:recombinase family protein n=1 Tax=Kitasatospora sp. NPDC004723 TaxID=3154288 RepID=UPI0033AC3284